MNEHLAKLEAAGASLVAIAPDDPDETRTFAEDLGVGFPLVADPDNAIAASYAADIRGAAMYFIRPDGVIQYGYTDPPNTLDRPPIHMVIELAVESGKPGVAPRKSEFDAPCRPHKGVWICE